MIHSQKEIGAAADEVNDGHCTPAQWTHQEKT